MNVECSCRAKRLAGGCVRLLSRPPRVCLFGTASTAAMKTAHRYRLSPRTRTVTGESFISYHRRTALLPRTTAYITRNVNAPERMGGRYDRPSKRTSEAPPSYNAYLRASIIATPEPTVRETASSESKQNTPRAAQRHEFVSELQRCRHREYASSARRQRQNQFSQTSPQQLIVDARAERTT